jgi:hypothetical protein
MCRLPVQLTVLRPRDMVVISFRFDGLDLRLGRGSARLVPVKSPALLIAELPPQSIAEQAFYKGTAVEASNPNPDDTTEAPPAEAVKSRLSGPTRLVFEVTREIEFNDEALLDWSGLTLHVAASATSPSMPSRNLEPFPPAKNETAIEAPYRLILSPDNEEHFHNALDPKTKGSETELWHTRLERGGKQKAHVRAIWTPDMAEEPAGVSIDVSMWAFTTLIPTHGRERPC